MGDIRDPRTKTGWSRTVRFGPGPRTGPNQDQQNLENLGPIGTGRSVDPCVIQDSVCYKKSFVGLGLGAHLIHPESLSSWMLVTDVGASNKLRCTNIPK